MKSHDPGAHGPGRHRNAALGGGEVAQGRIRTVSGSTFVLATDAGEVPVVTSADTSFHGLSRKQARDAGYEDPTAINTLATLRVSQHVGVTGARREDAALLAHRVHGFEA